jgi:hypothetical protein
MMYTDREESDNNKTIGCAVLLMMAILAVVLGFTVSNPSQPTTVEGTVVDLMHYESYTTIERRVVMVKPLLYQNYTKTHPARWTVLVKTCTDRACNYVELSVTEEFYNKTRIGDHVRLQYQN